MIIKLVGVYTNKTTEKWVKLWHTLVPDTNVINDTKEKEQISIAITEWLHLIGVKADFCITGIDVNFEDD